MRWMVRKEGLTDEQNDLLDRLNMPERKEPTRFLPPNVVAVIFDGDPFDILSQKITMIEDRQEPEPNSVNDANDLAILAKASSSNE